MDVVPDPKVALIAGVIAGMVSPPVRRAVGKGVGYAARGAIVVTKPVAHVGRDIYDSAREVATPDGGRRTTKRATTSA
jgi:hypothetical protein